MKINYKGKWIQKDESGTVLRVYPPCAIIGYQAGEADTVMRLLDATDYLYDLFGHGDDMLFAQVAVKDAEDYHEFVQEFRHLRKIDSMHPGDDVYAIVSSNSWTPMVVAAEVKEVTYSHILLMEPKRYRGVAHTEWSFPIDAIGKEIFTTRQRAREVLAKKNKK